MDPLELLRGTAQPSYGAIKNGEDDDSGGDLAAFVSKLATKSPKAKSTPKASGTAKRRIRPQTSAVSAESEYAVMQTGGGDQLSVDALLGSSGAVTDKSVASVLSPEAAAKPRASNVVEERVTRKAAYSSKASELDRWNQSIKINRNAETLDLRVKDKSVAASTAGMVSKFTPTTDMELEITRLLQGSGASGLGDEKGVERSEEAEMVSSGLTEAQARAKHAELSKMRSLLFYEQQKRKRVSKIKSKAYHRIRKRQAARRGEGQEGEGDDLAELDPEAAAAAEEKEALARMEERAGLKHKNTSKWAKQQLKAGVHGSGVGRKAMGEQLRLGEELRKKATDKPKMNEGGSSDSSDSSDDDEDYQGSASDARAEAVKETEALLLGMNQDDDKASGSGNSGGDVFSGGSDKSKKAATKGLAGMKFMQKAAQRQREAARGEAEALLKELAEGERLSSDDDDEVKEGIEEEEQGEGSNISAPEMLGDSLEVVGRAGSGKRVRVDQAIDVGAPKTNGKDGEKTKGTTANTGKASTNDDSTASNATATVAPLPPPPVPQEVANPWLDPSASSSRQKKRKASSSSSSEAAHVVDVDRATAAALAGTEHEDKAAAAKDSAKKRVKGWAGTAAGGAHTVPRNPDASSSSSSQHDAAAASNLKELTQAELVARAFAAPDFETELAANKEAQLGLESKAKAPAVESDGWGSWAGMGAPPPVSRKPAVASKAKHDDNKRPHSDAKEQPSSSGGGAPASSSSRRTDRSLPLVMINQKRVKAAARLKVEHVPYPFTSREQYERSLAVPIGKEWNGMRAARGFARPKVVTDAGRTINPIKLAGGKKGQHQAPLSRAR